MYKLIIYIVIFINLFSVSFGNIKANNSNIINFNIENLKIQNNKGVIFASLTSLNNSGFHVKKNQDTYIVSTGLGDYILKDSSIITNHKSYTYISAPYEDEISHSDYLPLDLLLYLNGYYLDENSDIKKIANLPLIKSYPKKIVSLSPAVTEKIFALGGGDLLVGRTKYSSYPKEVKNIDIVGSMLEPNLEIISSKSPDLVIAETHFKEKLIASLSAIGVDTIKFYTPKNIDEIYKSITKLGHIIDRDMEARALNASLINKINFVNYKLKDKSTPKVYYALSSGKSDFTAGKNTFINSLIEIAKGDNIAKDNKGWSYNLETLVLKNPEIIFGQTKTIDTINTDSNYQSIDAVVNNRCFPIENTDVFNLPGPRALTVGLYEMIKIFHPNLALKVEKITK